MTTTITTTTITTTTITITTTITTITTTTKVTTVPATDARILAPDRLHYLLFPSQIQLNSAFDYPCSKWFMILL